MAATPEGFIASLQKLLTKFEADKARHASVVALVERMLELSKARGRCSAGLRPADAAHSAARQEAALELDRIVCVLEPCYAG